MPQPLLSGLLAILALGTAGAGAPRVERNVPRDRAAIDLWVRHPGAIGTGETAPVRERAQQIALDDLPLTDRQLSDVQYNGTFTYRGIELAAIIERFGPPASADLALLHFVNGMQIPLAFRDADVMGRLSPFVARGMRLGPKRPMQLGRFPKVSRPNAAVVDPRPTTFLGNKLVVAERGHPDVPPANRDVLSPWALADSLSGIEFVSRAAYYAQFDVDADPAVKEGERLFTQSCQFCHGVRETGAAFGWDFVVPTPVAEYRQGRNFFLHVRYKPQDAVSRGLRMPALSYMTEDDARSLWRWLKAVADRPLRPYQP